MPSERKAAPQKKNWLVWVRRIIVIVLGIEVGWLVLAHLFLNTPIGPWAINRKPEKYMVTWERVLTPYPAKVYVTGFRLEQRSPKLGLTITADKVSARIGVLPFLTRTLRASGVEVGSLAVALDRSGGSGLPPSTKKKPGMTFKLLDIDVETIEEFRFDEVAVFGGASSVTGDFEMEIRREMAISDADLEWRGAEIRMGEEPIAHSLDLGFRGGFSPFNPKREKGLAMVPHLSADIDVTGRLGSLVPLQVFFAGTKWIERIDGSGDIRAAMKIADGHLQPGTVIDIDADDLLLDFMGFRTTGDGMVDGRVTQEEETHSTLITLEFDNYRFGRQGEEPMARGTGLVLETSGEGLGAAELLSGMNVTLDLPEANVPDIAQLDQLLPAGLEVTFTGGLATMAAHLEAEAASEAAQGTMTIMGDELSGRFNEFEFNTDLALEMNVSGSDWDDFEVRLQGTELRLFNGEFHHPDVDVSRGWWMTVNVPDGRANLAAPLVVEAEVDLAMRDTRVIVALFAEMKSWVKHVKGLLTVQDVTGSARLKMVDRDMSLRDLVLEGEKLEALGELEMAGQQRDGLFWARYGMIRLALERLEGRREWKMVNARKWFDERRASNWAADADEAVSRQ